MTYIDVLESNDAWDFNSDIYKSFILFVDMISSLLYISLQTSVSDNGSDESLSLAIASIVVVGFCAIGSLIAMIIIAVIVLRVKLNKNNNNAWPLFTADCLIITGALFYFTGDNIPTIFATFSEEFSCGESCIEKSQTAGRCLLFFALIIFRISPLLLRKWISVTKSKALSDITDSNLKAASFLIHMLALMVEYDAVYSVVWSKDSIINNKVCSDSDIGGSWVSWSLSALFWIAFVVGYFFLENRGCHGDAIKDRKALVLMVIALILVCVTLGLYFLGDNDIPIECVCNDSGDFSSGFGSTFATTSSVDDIQGCIAITGKKIRSGLMGGTVGFVLGTVVIIVIFLARPDQ